MIFLNWENLKFPLKKIFVIDDKTTYGKGLADEFEKEVEKGKRIIVGLNKFQSDEDEEPELLKIDMKVQEEQVKFLNKIRRERNQQEVDKALKNLENAANGNNNLIPFIIDAVKAYASVGEICNTMRNVFGEYKELIVI